MTDYKNHTYCDLFAYIEDGCKRIGEERDLVSYLLSMEDATSIERLVKIYDNIFKLIATFVYGTENWPRNWYMCDYWGIGNAQKLNSLSQYFNVNLLRLFKQIEKPTEEDCIKFVVNIRECDNSKAIQDELLQLLNISNELVDGLSLSRKTQHGERKKLENYNRNSWKSASALGNFEEMSTMLVGNGRILDLAEISICKQNGINHETLAAKYIEEKKREEEFKKREREEENRKEKSKMVKGIIYAILIVLVGLALLYVLEAVGGPLGIFLIIGLIGSFLNGDLVRMGGKK